MSKLMWFRRLVNERMRIVTENCYPVPEDFHTAQRELKVAFARSYWPALDRCVEARLRALGYNSTEADDRALALDRIRSSVSIVGVRLICTTDPI